MSRTKRKLEHIEYALKTGQSRQTGLDDVSFVHVSLPGISLDEASLHTKIGELSLSSPIFINAMTGGGGPETEIINRNMAIAARETGVAMSVGSQMAALKDVDQRSSYRIVRKENPKGIIFGNIGAEATVEQALQAVEMLEADALQIHLNVIQELVMPEGDRDFSRVLPTIEAICCRLDVPVIVKEVGFGMSKETVSTLASVGVSIADVGGFGGTNFAQIENERRSRMLHYFNDWGIPTAVSVIEASSVPNIEILASGGIQNAMDAAKCLALGARGVGVAGYFLKVCKEQGVEALIKSIEEFHFDLAVIMTALGARTVEELREADTVLSGETLQWIKQRML
ncbi:type 2 isopentenyl-diphosphate Delta-isomerase [Bacillus sp. 1P06AnD]|uniref:type 2 isopentenyl-diphosphate Delta-isomerase n=1 Tax=Bacillus sp. 1P06AnD TaxID=3132208 RepID=UPI0039A1C7BD